MHLKPLMDDPDFSRIFDHWLSIRNGGSVPLRRDLDPSAIGPALPFVWLYDYLEEDGTYRCRLAGDHIREAFKHRMSGMLVDEIYTPDVAKIVRGYWDQIRNGPAVVFGVSKSPGRQSGGYLKSKRLMLPLAGDDGTIRQVFGITRYDFDSPDYDINKGVDGSELHVIACSDLDD